MKAINNPVKGVSFSATEGKWLARGHHKGKRIYLGRYLTEKQANVAVLSFHKTIAVLNKENK